MGIESKSPEVRYLTHMIIFPDDDAMVEQLPFVHDLQFEATNWQHTIFHHFDEAKSLIRDLITKGEARTETRYPPGGVTAKLTHIWRIENDQRITGWAPPIKQ